MRRDINRRQSPAVTRMSLFQWRGSTLHIEGKALGPCPFSHLRLARLRSYPDEKFRGSRLRDWMTPTRRDFSKRFQHKRALHNTRMGQDETAACSCSRCPAQNQSTIIENIKVERARSPTNGTPAAGGALDRVKPREQRLGWQMRLDTSNGVDEIGLVRPTKGRCFNQPRCRDKFDSVAVQFTKRPLNGLTRRPPGPCHIGSQRDKYHDCA